MMLHKVIVGDLIGVDNQKNHSYIYAIGSLAIHFGS